MKDVVLLIVLPLLLLVACQETKKEPQVVETVVTNEERELFLWEYMHPDLDESLDRIFEQFTLKTGILVNREHVEPNQLRDDYLQMALAGEGPQVIWLPSDMTGFLKASDTLLSLKSVFSPEFFQKFTPTSLSHVALDGEYVGVPILRGNSLCLIYNKDLTPEPPQTWEELVAVAKKFQGDGKYGISWNQTSPFFFIPYLTAYGGAVFVPGTSTPQLNTPAMIKALEFFSDLKFKDKIMPLKGDSNQATKLFKEGKSLYLINGPWIFKGLEGVVNFGVTRLPPINGFLPRPYTSAGTILLNKTLEKDPIKLKSAQALIEFLVSPAIQIQLARLAKEEPAVKEVVDSPELKEDPLMVAYLNQVSVGIPMPNVPEMRFVWAAMGGSLEDVSFGKRDFSRMAEKMQQHAEDAINAFSKE